LFFDFINIVCSSKNIYFIMIYRIPHIINRFTIYRNTFFHVSVHSEFIEYYLYFKVAFKVNKAWQIYKKSNFCHNYKATYTRCYFSADVTFANLAVASHRLPRIQILPSFAVISSIEKLKTYAFNHKTSKSLEHHT
jgi:hypothetical protein